MLRDRWQQHRKLLQQLPWLVLQDIRLHSKIMMKSWNGGDAWSAAVERWQTTTAATAAVAVATVMRAIRSWNVMQRSWNNRGNDHGDNGGRGKGGGHKSTVCEACIDLLDIYSARP
jgi:hypothetical protein